MVVFIVMLIIIAIVDIKTMEIPNKFVAMIGAIGIMAFIFQDDVTFASRLIGFICVSLPLLIITLVIPNAFGGGDIKLMAVSGFYLGGQLTLLSFFLGVIGAGVYGVWLIVVKGKGKKEHFAFGPFLCGGMIIALLFGAQIVSWYLR
jgi:leader peptidase (prepilin peptidase)/N-methyltransferase